MLKEIYANLHPVYYGIPNIQYTEILFTIT